MNPYDALWQQQLLRANLTKPAYHSFLQYFAEDMREKESGPVILGPNGKVSGYAMAMNQIKILERAETYYVSADMTDVMVLASHGLDDLDQFSHDLWPTDDGFLLFQKGIASKDVWSNSVSTNALVWQRQSAGGRPGMLVTLYANLDDPNDRMGADMSVQERDEVSAQMGRLSTSSIMWVGDGERVGSPTHVPDADYAQYAQEGQALANTVENPSRVILSLLMLLNQTIVDLARHDLRPANPKRARKMKVPGMVTVITLRHTKASRKQEGESHIEWQYRTLVRAYWKSQPCGPNYPMAQEISPGVYRARLYISPYIRGPEDKPIRQTTKIYSLTR